MSSNELITNEKIQNKIFTIRGLQVMIDSDLADFYGVEVKRLNEQVKRNIERFPAEFCFKLSEEENESLMSYRADANVLRSQFATLNKKQGKHRKYLPYAFSEQGVAMLSAVLRSQTAVKTSIQIINAFIAMRRFIAANAQVFYRLDGVERRQLEYKADSDRKFERIFNAIEERSLKTKQGIFFDGQIFDAYQFISDLIRSANKSILLIDNYIDDTVLIHLTKRKKNVNTTILTKIASKQLKLDVEKFNKQYPEIEIKEFKNSHDRFLIIDNKAVYHFGASLKDLGKKWFAFSKMGIGVGEMLRKLDGMG
jgi:hypothetical protein